MKDRNELNGKVDTLYQRKMGGDYLMKKVSHVSNMSKIGDPEHTRVNGRHSAHG